MPVHVEVFATSSSWPDRLWAVVGDLSRLPEWTDAEGFEGPPPAHEVGAAARVVLGGRALPLRVTTADPMLVEILVDTPRGEVGIGARVARQPGGSRLVLAGAVPGARGVSRLRAVLLDAPALRRRFDAWAAAALRLAERQQPG